MLTACSYNDDHQSDKSPCVGVIKIEMNDSLLKSACCAYYKVQARSYLLLIEC